jgi:four helix bundle protein
VVKESPIFSKTYLFVQWLIPLTVRFPRQQRFVLASALQQEALSFQGLLIEAAHRARPSDLLVRADAELDKLRTHLRLSRDLQLVSPGQYEHAAHLLVEIGKLLGGWKKSIASG